MARKKSSTTARLPSKAAMAKQERLWQAERLVIEGMKDTPEFKKAVKVAEKALDKGEKDAKAAIQGKKS